MADSASTNANVIQLVEDVVRNYRFDTICVILIALRHLARTRRMNRRRSRATFTRLGRVPDQVRHINRLVGVSDVACLENLRMDRNTFGRLCIMLCQTRDLVDGEYVMVEEQVAMFLSFKVSHYVHAVLRAVLKLHASFLVTPEPVPDDYDDNRWKWFKGCLGAIDGTYINVHVPNADKPRYRYRKGQICTSTLAACDRLLRFTYVLAGWEGSTADVRVLPNAITRPNDFKMRWGILRTASYYPVKIQTWLIIACFLLHNYIRSEMPTDPIEMTENDEFTDNEEAGDDGVLGEFVDRVEPSPAWKLYARCIGRTHVDFSEIFFTS
ncbi:uncharacterized protein LOC121772777 [Salvia splendens]|uniref:uncharacterized protein LOC121772777 n=1 Tax=Salvia splendens TaxID=180675 RepID=UPI001C26AB0B|nr:uncharacterized protein LOC121772777 [Salvia splendens]